VGALGASIFDCLYHSTDLLFCTVANYRPRPNRKVRVDFIRKIAANCQNSPVLPIDKFANLSYNGTRQENDRKLKESAMRAKLVQNKRESDGKFSLLLESQEAVQRDLRREVIRRQRAQQLREAEENAGLIAQGIDPSEVFA
jgi:hypothetical protein